MHPEATGQGYGAALRARAERRGTARASAAPPLVRQFVPAGDVRARAHLLAAGWWPVHHYFRLRAELARRPAAARVLTREFARERDAEAVWHLVQGAYTAWRASSRSRSRLAREQRRAARLRPGAVAPAARRGGHRGAALGERREARTGLITTVAVSASRARGRGRGRTLVSLLLAAFRAKELRYAEAAAHGPTAAAARVFESAGMQVVRETERWEKVLGV